MSAEPPPDTARARGRALPLSASMLRRIRARCVTRARRYRRNHAGFSRRDEMYFFFGAQAVLGGLRDPGARALAKEWLGDFAGGRSPCDQSATAQAARLRDRERAAEMAAFFRSLDAQLAGLDAEIEAELLAMDGTAPGAGKDGAQ